MIQRRIRFGLPSALGVAFSKVVVVISMVALFEAVTASCMAAQTLENEVAQEVSAADLLPETTVIYAQIPRPAAIVEYLMQHPLRKSIEGLPPVAEGLASREVAAFQGGVALFEAGMGMRLPLAVENISRFGAHFAVDAESEGFVLLVQGSDLKTTEAFRDLLMSTALLAAQGNDAVKQTEYRGTSAYRIGEDIVAATVGAWIVVSNKPELGRTIVDRLLDSATAEKSLASKTTYQAAAESAGKSATAWVYFDVDQLRDLGVAPELYRGRTENILAEMLIGGLLSNLQHTPYVSAELQMMDEQATLTVHSPHKPEFAGEDRRYFFGDNSQGIAPALLPVEQRAASFSFYRGLAEAWLRSGDLLTDKASEELAQADSQLSTFFSGQDFGDDILASFGEQIQFVVSRQTFGEQDIVPAIKLPGFALQLQMLDPKRTRPEMRRVFISLLGFLNVIGAMNGQPQFDFEMVELDEAEIVSANYVRPKSDIPPGQIPINYNFTPTLAMVDERLIVASSRDLAEQVIAAGDVQPGKRALNTEILLEAAAIRELLADNLEQLIAQNMLENGHSRTEAAAEIGLLLKLAEFFKQATLDLDTKENQLQLRLELTWQVPAENE